MDSLQVFNNEEFGSIRILEISGEPWFIGKEIAIALGYENTRDAIARHVDEEDKNTVAIHDGIKGNPNMTIINESGMYALIFSSRLPKAKEFKHWVTSEVLPSIRKTGSYSTNTANRLKNADLPEITAFLHETSSFLREMDRVMRDQNSHPSDIAEEFKNVCDQFGIVNLSDNFVKEPAVSEPMHFITLEEMGIR